MISSIMANLLTFFHDSLGVGWGMSIVFLTLLVKVVLFPFSLSQIRSMEGIKNPAGDEKNQEKYKNNPEEQQGE